MFCICILNLATKFVNKNSHLCFEVSVALVWSWVSLAMVYIIIYVLQNLTTWVRNGTAALIVGPRTVYIFTFFFFFWLISLEKARFKLCMYIIWVQFILLYFQPNHSCRLYWLMIFLVSSMESGIGSVLGSWNFLYRFLIYLVSELEIIILVR